MAKLVTGTSMFSKMREKRFFLVKSLRGGVQEERSRSGVFFLAKSFFIQRR